MAKKALAKNWRVNRHILGATVCVLFSATIVLMAVLCFWLFFSSPGDAGNDIMLNKPKKVGIEEVLPDEEAVLGDPVAVWPDEKDGQGEGDAPE